MNVYDIIGGALIVYFGCIGVMLVSVLVMRKQNRKVLDAGQRLHDLAALACNRHTSATRLGHRDEWARLARTVRDLEGALEAWEELTDGTEREREGTGEPSALAAAAARTAARDATRN